MHFKFDQFPFLSFGKGLNHNFLEWTKFKAFADDKLTAAKMTISLKG